MLDAVIEVIVPISSISPVNILLFYHRLVDFGKFYINHTNRGTQILDIAS